MYFDYSALQHRPRRVVESLSYPSLRGFGSAVVNGILAAPVMAVMMLIAGDGRVMDHLTLPRPMMIMGWLATLVMLAASIGFFVL